MRVSEAAKFLSFSRSTTYELIEQGVIPSLRLGKSIRVPVDALQEKLLELRRGAVTTAA